MKRTGAEIVVEGLERAGVEILYGIPGGSVLDIFARLYHSKIRFVLTRHEQGATHMADGYSRATGRVGCCLVTSGPGATNAVTGLATACMDGIPMVCVSGQVPTSMIGNDAFQEADTTGITRAVTKHNYLVRRVEDLPRIMVEAFYIAASGKPGPVLIDIPKDVQRATTEVDFPTEVSLRGYKPPSGTGHPRQIAKLAEAINAARKPVLYIGGGVIAGNAATELTAVAHKARIPVTTTLLGIGGFPDEDPLALRMLGMHGTVPANKAVSECDLLISAGARFDDRVTGRIADFAPHAKIAHIDIDAAAVDKSVRTDIPVVGHVRDVLRDLLPLLEPRDRSDWLKQVDAWKAAAPLTYDHNDPQILPQAVIETVWEQTRGEAIVVTDVGQHQMWTAHFYKFKHPRTFLSSGGLGTMGFGLPAAIGARSGCPDKPVVVIAGDGSIQMNFQELVVSVENDFPVKLFILNNAHLGMVRQWQEMFYKKEYSAVVLKQSERPPNERVAARPGRYLPDFVRLAEAHGATGIRVEQKADLPGAVARAFATPGTVVVECVVKQDENVYPMVPPGASLTEMIQGMA